METNDLTVRVLIEIRDEIRGVKASVDATNARIDETNSRIDRTNQRLESLEHRVVEMDKHHSQDIHDLTAALNTEVIFGHRDLRHRIERCERDIDELKRTRG